MILFWNLIINNISYRFIIQRILKCIIYVYYTYVYIILIYIINEILKYIS